MPTLIHQRVRECRSGSNPRLVCRVRAGWVVLGDVQFLRGYSLLLPDPVVPHLNVMQVESRTRFLADMARLGDAVLEVTSALRINYSMFGNLEPALHAHVIPRFAHEADALRTAHPWAYDWAAAPQFDSEIHGVVLRALQERLR